MPPPPPPSASYNLVIEDSSSEEEVDEYQQRYFNRRMMMEAEARNATVHRATGYLPTENGPQTDTAIPWAEAVPASRVGNSGNYPTVEAASVVALSDDDTTRSTPRRSGRRTGSYRDGPAVARKLPTENEAHRVNTQKEDDGCDEKKEEKDARDGTAMMGEEEGDAAPPAKKKKKKKKNSAAAAGADADDNANVTVDADDCVVVEREDAGAAISIDNATAEHDASAKDCNEMEEEAIAAKNDADAETNETPKPLEDAKVPDVSKPKARSATAISFGSVSVREYARTLGTHVVPADGGWPLGLSSELVAEHPCDSGCCLSNGDDSLSSPRRRSRSRSNSLHSPNKELSKEQHHPEQHSHPSSWSIDDFESRKQTELKQRYTQLIQGQRRRKFEKEWEKKHHKHHHSRNTRGSTRRSRSGSFGRSSSTCSSGNGSGRSMSGSFSMKAEMTPEEKSELESILSQPVILPDGEIETRPYDYKKKVLPKHLTLKGPSGKGNNNDNGNAEDVTEEQHLYHNHGGRNPIFMPMREGQRQKVLLRDDHLMTCQFITDKASSKKSFKRHDKQMEKEPPLDPTDNAVTQHIQHDIETLRIQRSDPTNLGCSCRKLHVFLPGATGKSHHKKRGSHRRLPERKVREELRKRSLLNKGNESMSRDKMEKLLHDAIEKEPCCWGNDCPCVRGGIECQADTCSCWHASHDVAHSSASNSASTSTSSGDPLRKGGEDVESMKARCGNKNGMYVVNSEGIARYREQYVTAVERSNSTIAEVA